MTVFSDTVPKSFGVFKPIGYVVASFPDDRTAQDAAESFVAAGFGAADVHFHSAAEVADHSAEDVAHASFLADIGQDLNLVRGHLALARSGHGFVAVRALNQSAAEHDAGIAKRFDADHAQYFGHFVVEELIDSEAEQ